MDWFRSWHGAPTDNKWLVIARRAGVQPVIVSAVFWALLDYASQQTERGSVAGFDVETYALWAGVDEADILSVLDAMRAKGVISDGDTLAAWDKRQPKREDDSAERVRRHRDKKRQSVTDDGVTHGNAPVTHGNAPDKIQIQNRGDTEESRQEQTTTNNSSSGGGDLRAKRAAVFQYYQDTVSGTLTATTADMLDDDIEAYGADEVIFAIGEAARANKANLRYIEGILRRRATGDEPKRNGTPPKQKRTVNILDGSGNVVGQQEITL